MERFVPITDVYAREILDSRGNPTIEVEVLAGEKYLGRASVPSGASTGSYEAIEVRDKEKRYNGLGVEIAVNHVNFTIAPVIVGENVLDQLAIDQKLIKLDGTENKHNLGANAILGVSMAVARAAAEVLQIPLYAYLGGVNVKRMPIPMMNVLNGGKHADNTIDIQEFMIVPVGAKNFRDGLRMCAEIYHALKSLLKKQGYATAVGDEGGFAPDLSDTKEVLKCLVDAIIIAGYRPNEEVQIALDVAASELYDKDRERYVFENEENQSGHPVARTVEEMIDFYEELSEMFPICSIEDPLDEEDWDGWELLTTRLGNQLQLVGDDLFVTNTKRLQKGIEKSVANAILIKMNQIGTLSETFETIQLAQKAGYQTIISHRSGETTDTMIAEIAVAFHAGQIKAGAPCRGERIEKYNQLLRIEEKIGK